MSCLGTWWALVLRFSWRPSQFSSQLQVGKSASSTDSVVMSRFVQLDCVAAWEVQWLLPVSLPYENIGSSYLSAQKSFPTP